MRRLRCGTDEGDFTAASTGPQGRSSNGLDGGSNGNRQDGVLPAGPATGGTANKTHMKQMKKKGK
jgi:hypothetical protein